jgi:succinylarginine dihydrolase
VLRAIFADTGAFEVHDPLPGGTQFSDEGAANHTRLFSEAGLVHLFAWGRLAWAPTEAGRYPRRQSREASEALARLGQLADRTILTWQQSPAGIDGGAFHTDVLAVGQGAFLMLHDHAFVDTPDLLTLLAERLGSAFSYCQATNAELPVADAVNSYPFNSQLVALPTGAMAIVAPTEAHENERARRFLERVVDEPNPVSELVTVDVNASMQNGGGPACLRLRVILTDEERRRVRARVFLDAALDADLVAWVERTYRDRLAPDDLADPALLNESRTALDELTALLGLGSVYDFQRNQ